MDLKSRKLKTVGGINQARGQRYLRARAEISSGAGGDIFGHGRRYLRIKAEIYARKAA